MMEPDQNHARQSSLTITLDDYRDIGALEEALSTHADEVLKSLTDEQQRIAQVLFRRLTERGAGRGDRRRPTRLLDVADVATATVEEVGSVVEEFRRFDRSFLTPLTGTPLKAETILDITHESLISLWQTLDGWVDDEARSAAIYDRLKKTARDWPNDAELWGGIDLERALKWKDKQQPSKAWARRYGTEEDYDQAIKFLDASEKAWLLNVEREASREKLKRENEIERETLKAKAKIAWKLKLLTAALAVVAIIAGVAAAIARSQSNQATANLVEADKQRTQAEESLKEAERQKQRATLAALDASSERVRAEENEKKAVAQADLAKRSADEAKQAEARALTAQADAEKARAIADQQAGTLLKLNEELKIAQKLAVGKADEATANAKSLEVERDLLQQEKRKTEEALKEAKENLTLAQEAQTNLNIELKNNLFRTERTLSTQTAFSADASKVLTFSTGQTASVWNTITGANIQTLKAGDDFQSAALSRDGGRVAIASRTGDIVLRDLVSGNELRRLRGIVTKPAKVVLSGDAKRVAVLDAESGIAKVVDFGSGEILAEVGGGWPPIVSISFSEDGRQLAVTDLDGESKLVQIRPGQQVLIGSLTTGTCRPSAFDFVNFSPRPDLRARLYLETRCLSAGTRPRTPRSLTRSQVDFLLGPAADAKAVDSDVTKKPANEAIQNTLKKEDQPVDSNPSASVTATPNTQQRIASGETEKPQLTKPIDTPITTQSTESFLRPPGRRLPDQIRSESLSFKLEQREANGQFLELATFSMNQDNEGGGEISSFMEKLRVNSISDDVIRKISASIIDCADKLAEVKGDSIPEMQKQNDLIMDLYKRIMAELGLKPSV